MTTSSSPLPKIKVQADRIAQMMKAAERGEQIAHDPDGKIAEARARDSFSVAIAMDDKIIKIEIPWSIIRITSEVGLSEYIVGLMRDQKNTVQ